MIVADTNLIAYTLIHGVRTSQAQAVRRKDPSWIVPLLWRYEFLNVLVHYNRHRGASSETCLRLWSEAVRLFNGRERPVDPAASLEFACRHRITAYDAQFVVLGATLGIPFVTEDHELLRKFPGTAVSMGDFVG